MPKNRLNPPKSTAVLQRGPSPNFKPRNSGAIARVGSIKPKTPPADKPKSHGERKSIYWNK